MKKFNYKYDDLFNPVLKALRLLGGSGSNSEIEEKVIQLLDLTDDQINDIHKDTTTKLNYRLRWARNYLKRYGWINNSVRGIWSLVGDGLRLNEVDQKKVVAEVRRIDKKKRKQSAKGRDDNSEELDQDNWQDTLVETVLKIPPEKFERLCQRMLRELGFVNVEVTGRSGDGGIDGRGILKLGGVLSFHVVFQCKRYKKSVSSSTIRDFRGAMVGRADKGLVITTGTFTRDAKQEAQRDGATPIDLIDGSDFAEKLKELELGVSTRVEEKVSIDKSWFQNF